MTRRPTNLNRNVNRNSNCGEPVRARRDGNQA